MRNPLHAVEVTNLLAPEVYARDILGIKRFTPFEKIKMMGEFRDKVQFGLKSPIMDKSCPYMLPTYLSPPNADYQKLEGKKAIAIDVGGTNLRMGIGEINNELIKPIGDMATKEISNQYKSLNDFFKMLLDNGLKNLLQEYPDEDIPFACIFSFPGTGEICKNGLDMIMKGNMPKGWKIGGSEGKRLGEELNNYLERVGLKKRKYLIANDTVALIKDQQTDAGIVCASGYNWSFVVDGKIINIEAGQSDMAPRPSKIISDRLIEQLARAENTPKDKIIWRDEYQVSGKYLGRILGITIDELKAQYPNLFLSVKNTEFTKSFIISDILGGKWNYVKKWFKSRKNFSELEKDILTKIAAGLRDRSAQIVTSHLIALYDAVYPQRKDQLNISSDGPIIQKMPGWKKIFTDEVDYFTESKLKINIEETPYQGKMHDFRGIFDVMSQAIEYFNRN